MNQQRMKRQAMNALLSNDEIVTVTLTIRDSLAYESAARGRGWGSPADHPMRMQAIRAWSAIRREQPGVIGDIGWQQFVEGTDPEQLHLIDLQPADLDSPAADDGEANDLGESGRADRITD